MELIVSHGQREERVFVQCLADRYVVRVGDATYEVEAESVNDDVRSLLVDGRQYEVGVLVGDNGAYRVTSRQSEATVRVVDPLTHLAQEAHAAVEATGVEKIIAYMPGRVVTVLVKEGAPVSAGQGLLVLEAMKMENEIQAERAGTVRTLFVSPGQAVESGDPLIEIE